MSNEPSPHYEAIMDSLIRRLGPNPKAQNILAAVRKLAPAERAIIAAQSFAVPTMSPEQGDAFTLGFAEEMSSSEGEKCLDEEANITNIAVQDIQRMFNQLTFQLQILDKEYQNDAQGAFSPRLATINNSFRITVQESRALALRIAIYGENFDRLIIPLVQDENIPLDRKQEILKNFIAQAEGFRNESAVMQTNFDRLLTDFQTLTTQFGFWAESKRSKLDQRLLQIQDELNRAHAELASLRIAFTATASVATAAMPIAGIIAKLAGPFAPLVIIAGLVVAGVSTVSTIGILVAIGYREEEITRLERERERVNASLAHIDTTQAQMKVVADESFRDFMINLEVLQMTWVHVASDTTEILEHLQTAHGIADLPGFLEHFLKESVHVFDGGIPPSLQQRYDHRQVLDKASIFQEWIRMRYSGAGGQEFLKGKTFKAS